MYGTFRFKYSRIEYSADRFESSILQVELGTVQDELIAVSYIDSVKISDHSIEH